MLPGIQMERSPVSHCGPKELDLFYRISEVVHSVHTSRERFLQVMEILDETFGRMYGTLTLLSPSKREILLNVGSGDLIAQHGSIQGLNPAIMEEVIARAQPMVFSRITGKPLPSPSRSLHEKDLSLVCIPIMNNAQAVGVISTSSIYRDTLSFDKQMRLLEIIACMVFRDAPLPGDVHTSLRESKEDPPLAQILEGKLSQMIEKVDPRTESRCTLLPDIVSLVEKIVIKWALKRHHNVQTATSLLLGINRNTLRKKMKDLNIRFQKP